MIVFFNDKEALKKELKNKGNSKLLIKFKQSKKILLDKHFLKLIQQLFSENPKLLSLITKNEDIFLQFIQMLLNHKINK